MKALIQRVSQASVVVNHHTVGEIQGGLLVFLGVQPEDSEDLAAKLAKKVLGYRVFGDSEGKMNLSVADINAQVLVVSQFTLAADTKKGMRPSFTSAAKPDLAENLYECFVQHVKNTGLTTATGQFGADMQVSLVNDGPVTFMLHV